MSHLLRSGSVVRAVIAERDCEVIRLIGEGGQGEVYEADYAGQRVALKWYFPENGGRPSLDSLVKLVEIRSPDRRFLWPIDLAVAPDDPDMYGYVMELRPDRFTGVVDLIAGRVDPTFRALVTAGMELAAAFTGLHACGLQYSDISWGNVFFDPKAGDVLICDNDNVSVNRTGSMVLGTPKFMAPEIVRGEASPSRYTDLFSLAVLLFSMFTRGHPLDGKLESEIHCFDANAMRHLYGVDPVFIFDPQDARNRPDETVHAGVSRYWQIYPTSIQNLFVQSFTTGLKNPQSGRVGDTEWRRSLARLRDWILYCHKCSQENFYDPDLARAGSMRPCWSCGAAMTLPPRIRIGSDKVIILNHDTQLFPHHIDDSRAYDFKDPVASVTRHPTDSRVWGLKNLSKDKWFVTTGSGGSQDVHPGLSITLAPGTRIHFGSCEGEIRL